MLLYSFFSMFFVLFNIVFNLNFSFNLKIDQKIRTFKNLEKVLKTWKKFKKSEWQPCLTCSLYAQFSLLARESISVQIKLWLFSYESSKKYIFGGNLVYFILARFFSGHLSSVKSYYTNILAQSLTICFFRNILIKVVFKTYDKCFIDKLIKFLVGNSSVQRLYIFLKYYCFVNIVFSLNLDLNDYLLSCVINDL